MECDARAFSVSQTANIWRSSAAAAVIRRGVGDMTGILAYETFIGWNVLRPGARDGVGRPFYCESCRLPALLIRTPAPPGAARNRLDRRRRLRLRTGEKPTAVTPAKSHAGIKSKTVFLAARLILYVHYICVHMLCIIKYTIYVCMYVYAYRTPAHWHLRVRPAENANCEFRFSLMRRTRKITRKVRSASSNLRSAKMARNNVRVKLWQKT